MLKHLSKKLQESYPGRPKKGEVRRYKLTSIVKGIKGTDGNRPYRIPQSKSLPHSYPILDDGEHKNIVMVDRIVPTDNPKKAKQILGFVEFLATDGGMISITNENYTKLMNVDKFLFFSPFLVGANEKSYYIKHKWGMFIKLDNPEQNAEDFLNVDEEIVKAKGVVYQMEKQMMGIVVDQLKLGHSARMSEKAMRQALIIFCEATLKGTKGAGAKRILSLSQDKEIALTKLIKTAIAMDKIRPSENQTEMIWSKGGEVICPKLPGKTLIDSMLLFFISSDGREVLGALKGSIEAIVEGQLQLKDEFGPLKGSPEWDLLSPPKKGDLNKLRRERDAAEAEKKEPVVS